VTFAIDLVAEVQDLTAILRSPELFASGVLLQTDEADVLAVLRKQRGQVPKRHGTPSIARKMRVALPRQRHLGPSREARPPIVDPLGFGEQIRWRRRDRRSEPMRQAH
jgi:hypothetical protein